MLILEMIYDPTKNKSRNQMAGALCVTNHPTTFTPGEGNFRLVWEGKVGWEEDAWNMELDEERKRVQKENPLVRNRGDKLECAAGSQERCEKKGRKMKGWKIKKWLAKSPWFPEHHFITCVILSTSVVPLPLAATGRHFKGYYNFILETILWGAICHQSS